MMGSNKLSRKKELELLLLMAKQATGDAQPTPSLGAQPDAVQRELYALRAEVERLQAELAALKKEQED